MNIQNPSKYSIKTDHLLKRKRKKLSRENFKRMLNFIHWDLDHRGCDHWVIVNQKKEFTNLMITKWANNNWKIEEMNDEKMFGKSFAGGIWIYLNDCQIKLFNGHAISISMGKKNGGFHLLFSNHD